MFVQIFIAVMVYMMVQAVMFFTGVVLVPATPLADMAMKLLPWVVAITSIVSLPVAWLIALRLRALLAGKRDCIGRHLRPVFWYCARLARSSASRARSLISLRTSSLV
jgi:hypothetical protein